MKILPIFSLAYSCVFLRLGVKTKGSVPLVFENLSPETLDPLGMDAIRPRPDFPDADTFSTEGMNVIVLNEDCASVRQRLVRSPVGFLHPGVLLFVPPARRLEFSIGYTQEKWMFKPTHELHLMSNRVEVSIEPAAGSRP